MFLPGHECKHIDIQTEREKEITVRDVRVHAYMQEPTNGIMIIVPVQNSSKKFSATSLGAEPKNQTDNWIHYTNLNCTVLYYNVIYIYLICYSKDFASTPMVSLIHLDDQKLPDTADKWKFNHICLNFRCSKVGCEDPLCGLTHLNFFQHLHCMIDGHRRFSWPFWSHWAFCSMSTAAACTASAISGGTDAPTKSCLSATGVTKSEDLRSCCQLGEYVEF